METEDQAWKNIVARKREEQSQRMAKCLESNQIAKKGRGADIDKLDTPELLGKMSSAELTVRDVLKHYITKACAAHELTNWWVLMVLQALCRVFRGCRDAGVADKSPRLFDSSLTEVMFDDALRRAEELDRHLLERGETVGPLHGLPITLKDQFNIKGFDSTLGYVGRAFQPALDDCALVTLLRSSGAIILAKTNLPQSILWCETENPLWGLTTNPVHSGYTPGGSTGGESTMLACGASTIGWGTDIGGSIRIPAHMMGLYGFKPSSARLPYRGVPVSTDGQEHVPSSIGPMSRNLNMIRLVMESIIAKRPWELDARCIPLGWNNDEYLSALQRPLLIGVLWDDGVVRPHPPIHRVLRSAVETLRAAGHHVIDWDARLHAECVEIMDLFYTADGGEDIRSAVAAGGEPFLPHVERLVNRGEPISVYSYWQLNKRKWELQQAYLDKWESSFSAEAGRPVDVVLMPPMPHTAVPHRSCRWVGYTKVWNMLDYPALVIPGGTVEPGDVFEDWDYSPRNEMDAWNHTLWADNKEEMAALKLPVGVQIVGRRYKEEKVLAAGKILDDLLRGIGR